MALPARYELGSEIIGLTPKPRRPIYPGIPFHHWKSTLSQVEREEGRVPVQLWHGRAASVEQRGEILLGSEPGVEHVFRNEQHGKEDAMAHDLTLVLKDSPVRIIWAQMKPRRMGVVKFKQRIRDNLALESDQLAGSWTTDILVHEWMTDRGIVLLNGGETKSDDDISESYRPQAARIQAKFEGDPKQPTQFQIWPYVPEAKFTKPIKPRP